MTNITTSAGADSLGGDKLGDFNLSIKQHAEAVDFMKKFNVPMLVTGGQLFYLKCSAKACRSGYAASNLGAVAVVNLEYGVWPAVCCVQDRCNAPVSQNPLAAHMSVCCFGVQAMALPCLILYGASLYVYKKLSTADNKQQNACMTHSWLQYQHFSCLLRWRLQEEECSQMLGI
jgi:hypothetical protein